MPTTDYSKASDTAALSKPKAFDAQGAVGKQFTGEPTVRRHNDCVVYQRLER